MASLSIHPNTWPRLSLFLIIGLILIFRISTTECLSTNGKRSEKPPSSIIMPSDRRSFLSSSRTLLVSLVTSTIHSKQTWAAVTDETDTFGDNWWSTNDGDKAPPTKSSRSQSTAPASASDEVTVTVNKDDLKKSNAGLGIELKDIEFRTNLRVVVKSVAPNSLASKLGIQKDWVVVAVDGKSTERTNAQGVAQIIATAAASKDQGNNSIQLRFRDPAVFRQKLQNLQDQQQAVTTQVAPAGDTTQRTQEGSVKTGYSVTEEADQKVTVSQLVAPKMCTRGATTDDLLEISYVGRIYETGEIFDGSAVKIDGQGIPGRGNDVSIFFVLGKQPFGQFPPGWDVGLVGMCVGERRRLIIPPALAYGSTGVPRRGIPPDATLQYDVTLVSLNGLATPQ